MKSMKSLALAGALAALTAGAAAGESGPQTQTVPQVQTLPPTQTLPQTQTLRNSAALVPTLHDLSAGKLVQSPAGEVIGTVSDLVSNSSSGEPDYVLINTSRGTAALPFWAVNHMLRDAHFVLSPAELASAPRLPEGAERADSGWKQEADRYWQAYR